MECILIGTGGMMPMPYRMLSSMAVRLNGALYLFDAGEGTQINWKKARLGVRGLKVIAVTHLHADHCLGIPGMMMFKAQMEESAPLVILGPPGIGEFVSQCRRLLDFRLNYPVTVIEWSPESDGLAFCDEQAKILWQPVQHTRFCLGYRLEELDRPGKFSPERAQELGVERGPLWGRLQRGQSVTTPSQRTVEPSEVLGPPRRGRHVAFVVDTRPAPGVYALCREADLAFLEGMFLAEHGQHAEKKGHMTAVEAAAVARRAQVERVVLTHISPRYENFELKELEDEARREFEPVRVGRDLDTFAVSFPEVPGD
ncbi:MAG: ribonuclease Z [Syntrophobacteraceae bacterium]|nr:ribonuclease Z [Syntrophobacteraceae bacterium]